LNNLIVFAVRETYKTIAALQREGGEDGTGPEVKEYSEYYRGEVLEAGLRSGKLVAGMLTVNKHLSQQEAFVTRSPSSDVR
jgi:hypothetical protein